MAIQTRRQAAAAAVGTSDSMANAVKQPGSGSTPASAANDGSPRPTDSMQEKASDGLKQHIHATASTNDDAVSPQTAGSRYLGNVEPKRLGKGRRGRAPTGASVHASPASILAWRRVVLGTLFTLAWMFCSSALIVLNKELYRSGFAFPCAVTGMGQVSTCSMYACNLVLGTSVSCMPTWHTTCPPDTP